MSRKSWKPSEARASLFLASAVTAALLYPALVSADDWKQWRGPARDGVSQETGLLDEWPDGGPAVAWQIENLGQGYGSVSVEGNRLYIQGTRNEESMVFQLDANNGKELWARSLGTRLIQDKGNGPRSTPTIVGNHLYVQNGVGEVAKLDKQTGQVIWQFNMLERFGSGNIRWGISESPLVAEDRVYVMPGGDGAVAALSADDGSTIWRSTELRDRASYSSLIQRSMGNEDVLIGFTAGAGVGIRARDGKLLWTYPGPASDNGINVATPVLVDDLVFYTSSYGTGGGALRVDSNGFETEEVFFATRLQNHHGGVVVHDGTLYGFFGPALGAVDPTTGEPYWRARSVGKGSLVIADGKLFMLSENHRVGLAVATPEGYEERGRFEIEPRGDFSWAHPVVANGRLYIREQESLTAYEVAD